MRPVLAGLALWGSMAFLLSACQPPPKPVIAGPEPAPSSVARHRPPVVVAPIDSAWTFQTGEICTATASNPLLSLDVSASNTQLQLVLHAARRFRLPAHADVAVGFTGPAGHWTIPGVATPGRITITDPMTEYAAGRVLVLLGGGVIQVRKVRSGLPPLRVPSAGAPGRAWFECVRQRLFPE